MKAGNNGQGLHSRVPLYWNKIPNANIQDVSAFACVT